MIPRMVVGVLLVLGFWAAAAEPDYIVARDKASALTGEAALTAFRALAAGPFSPAQKSDALEQAATVALNLGRHDLALELAKKIPLPDLSKGVQMRVLAKCRKWADIVAQFKNEAIDDWWPDYLNGEAHFDRGRAYAACGNGPKAVDDLRKAAHDIRHNDNAKGLAWIALGKAYRDLLKDDARALAAFREAYRTSNICKRTEAAIDAAGILLRQGKTEAALAELKVIDLDKLRQPYWRACMLAAYGKVLAKLGRNDEALTKYREAAKQPGLASARKTAYEKAIDDLER